MVLLISFSQRRSRVQFPGCQEGNLENEAQISIFYWGKENGTMPWLQKNQLHVKEKPQITAYAGVCQAKIRVGMSLCPNGNEDRI